MEIIYMESFNFTQSYAVHIDINGPLNLTEMVPVIGMEGMVSHACLCYTQSHLTASICILIKPADMDKLMSFPASHVTITFQLHIPTLWLLIYVLCDKKW